MKTGMKRQPLVRLTLYLLALGGAALFTILLLKEGVQDVARAITSAGWGVAAILFFHFVPMGLDATTWWLVFPRGERPPFRTVYWMRWIGDSITNLAAAAELGGDLIRVRLAVLQGSRISASATSVVVNITLSVFTQTVFTFIGLNLLVAATGRSNLWGPAIAGAPIAIAAVAGFYTFQRLGMFRLFGSIISRCSKDPKWKAMLGKGGDIDQTVRTVYSDRGSILMCLFCEMASWFVGAIEVWIALWALGIPGGFPQAIVLEGVAQGVRSAMFFVPGALGIQEGGYVVVGRLLGIPAEMGLALALIRRVRELAFGIPGLIAWQIIEGSQAWKNTISRIASQTDAVVAETIDQASESDPTKNAFTSKKRSMASASGAQSGTLNI
jgi:putative membrane protein